MRNNRKPLAGLLLVLVLACTVQLPAQQTRISDAGFKRLGQIIHLFFDRFGEAATYVGKGNFSAKVGSPVFSRDCRKMQIRITGAQKMSIEAARHRIIRFFHAETPLPPRSEYVGFFRVFPPANLDKIEAGGKINLPYRLDLEVNLQQCVLIAAKSGINFALDQSKILESDKLLVPLQKIKNDEFRGQLEKLFPGMCRFLLNKGLDKVLNTALSSGQNKPQALIMSVGMDDFLAFVAYASVQAGKVVVEQQVKNLAAGAAGAAISAIVIPVPVVGEVALGAILVSLAVKNAPNLLSWGIAEFQKGMFRDRLGKATMYLMGKYPPGRSQVDWLIRQIKGEAARDDFTTLHKTLFFLRLQPVSVRRPWKKVLSSFAEPVQAQLEAGSSFKAERYLAIIRFLQSNS
ncbi:MAG: hypothetical protein AB1403_11320 [Candidatus Riflebacteria bacterium]